MPPKLTYTQFKDLVRKHGEYASAMLIGLYTRYLEGDLAQCVAEALTPNASPNQPTPAVIVPSLVVKTKQRPEAKNLADRFAQIRAILTKRGQPMNLDQIATAMDFTVSHTQKIMSKMVDQNLVLVTRARGQGMQYRYSLPEVK
ncbi:MAG: hypothetical protein WA154_12185 [Moraxellaceae bacterium]